MTYYPIGLRHFNFRKKASGFFATHRDHYQWDLRSGDQAAAGHEIAPILEEIYSERYSFDVSPELGSKLEKRFLTLGFQSKSLKISLDQLVSASNPNLTFKITFLIQIVYCLVNQGYDFSFQFSEVFLLNDDGLLPEHYSATDDYGVRSSDDYQKLIYSFSYQFGKGLFNKFRPEIDSNSSRADHLVACRYSSIQATDERNIIMDLGTPLAKLPCFNSAYEAFTYYHVCWRDNYSAKKWKARACLMLTFRSTDPVGELVYWLTHHHRNFYYNYFHETIFILQGNEFESAEMRARLYEALSSLLPQLDYSELLHIILLTQDAKTFNLGENLFSLAPQYQQENPFSPLAHNAGYYLNASELIASIGHKIQANDDQRLTSDWLQQVEISPKTPEIVPEEEEISGYIYGQESRENTRAAKGWNKETLKSQIGLTFKYNVTLEMQQSQSLQQQQNQDLAKEQSIRQQRQSQVKEAVDYPFYTPPLDISLFNLHLKSWANERLKKLPFEDAIKQDVYYTSWYRSNYSEPAILKKIVDYSSSFLVEHITKILGLAYTLPSDPSELQAPATFLLGSKIIPLPGYSCESIEAYLACSIHYHIGDFTDGINPLSRHVGRSIIFGNALMQGWDGVSRTFSPRDYSVESFSSRMSSLAMFANRQDRGYQSYFHMDACLVSSLLRILSPNRCDLYCLESAPVNPGAYSNSYIFLEKDEQLYYVDEQGNLVDSALTSYKALIWGLKRIKPIAENQFWLDREQIAEWITAKGGLTAPDRFANVDYIAEKEAEFFAFIQQIYPEMLAIVNKLFDSFDERNLDNLRILLQLFLSVGREKFGLFLNFLVSLDQKCLLNHFSKIYFSYAPTIFSLVSFFEKVQPYISTIALSHSTEVDRLRYHYTKVDKKNGSCFLVLAKRTPLSNSENDWPLFERFAHALIVFAAKNHMFVHPCHLEEIEAFWCRVAAKCLAYCEGNAKQQRQLIDLFLFNLLSKDGFKLAPLRKLDTLLVCLEKLLDHAIEKHMLWEQLAELDAISLAWTDVPYAIEYNGLHLVCKEMEIRASAMGGSSYLVSLSELKQAINERNASSSSLRKAVFRYLGKESFRENLSFYRSIYPNFNPEEQIIGELIWAYYVATYTGRRFESHPEALSFIQQCQQFLEQHPYAKTVPIDQTPLVCRFISRLHSIKSNGQTGAMTLWVLWQEQKLTFDLPSSRPMPEVLAKKFDRNELKRFLLAEQTELKAALPVLLDSVRREGVKMRYADRALGQTLLLSLFAGDVMGAEACFQLLDTLTPKFGINYFLDHLLEILILVETLRQMKTADPPFFNRLQIILMANPDINLAISLLKLCQEKLERHPECLNACTLFLSGLTLHPHFLMHSTSLSTGIKLIFGYFLNSSADETTLEILFSLYQCLASDVETLKGLLEILQDEKVYAFFHRHLQDELAPSLLQKATKLIKKSKDSASVLIIIDSVPDESLIEKLLTLEGQRGSAILFLFSALCTEQDEFLLKQLGLLATVPDDCLQTLVYLFKTGSISATTLKAILESASVASAIDEFEQASYERHLAYYDYDLDDIRQKIKEIQYNSWDDRPPKSLTESAQQSLLRDYKKLMDYIQNRVVYIEQKDGVERPYTIHQLKHRHFQPLFNALKERISRGENKKENQLALLALCCVALIRTTNKFPRSTQLLPLIHSLSEEGQLIQELVTGAGKSIIAAIHAVLRVAEGRTALIPTENEKLGRDGIENFQGFYSYLGVHCGERIIEAQSPDSDFVAHGVNYSTPYGVSLFFISMAIQKIAIPKNCDLIWDEIDASLTSTVPFRLAATLDPILLDTKNWSKVYARLLEFVQEQELFLENPCTKKADRHNFRQYCLAKNTDKELSDFLKRIPDPLLETFIESAMLAVQLEEKVDYLVVEKEEKGKRTLYGAPYLPHNSRAEPRASFGAGAQPLLHIDRNKTLPAEAAMAFSVLPDTETVVSMMPKNLADKIRRKGGRIFGATATPGMPKQLEEFREHYGITAVHYPSFHPDRCEDLGIFPAEGWDEQKEIARDLLEISRAWWKKQPVLLICETAQAATELSNYLNSPDYPWNTQSYYGYSSNPQEEVNFIVVAGNENMASISTKCQSRGADFDSEHEHGMFVINLCTHLTEEELRQIRGRAARNGQPGKFCSVIDVQALGLQRTASAEEIAKTFKQFQQSIGLKAQQDRARTLLLEDARCLVTWYLLDLRQKADRILSRQYGSGYSIVQTLEFMKTLRDFNKKAEDYYLNLLRNQALLNEESKQNFLEYLANEYNQILERWLPDEKFAQFQSVEPVVPLDKLETLQGIETVKIVQLLPYSRLFAMGWKAIGHQWIGKGIPRVEEVMDALDAQSGIKTLIGRFMMASQRVSIPNLITMLEKFEKDILEALEELPPAVEYVISKPKTMAAVTKYLTDTRTQLLEERWEDMQLPMFFADIFSLNEGHSSSSSSFVGFAAKGLLNAGIYPLAKLFVLPKIKKALQNQLKESLPDDEITQLQIMKAFQDLEPLLLDFLVDVPKNILSIEGIWSLILDKLPPILEHPSTQEIFCFFDKKEDKNEGEAIYQTGEGAFILEALKSFIKMLEPLRSVPLNEILTPKTLILLFRMVSQLGLVPLMLAAPEYEVVLNRFSLLDTEFLSAFEPLNWKALFNLIHLLAHPVFCKFLQALPPQANWGQVITWLNPETDNQPAAVTQALQQLHEFQDDGEMMAARSAEKIQGLKERFSLSAQKLQTNLQALKPVFPEEDPTPEPLSSRFVAWLVEYWLASLILLVLFLPIILFAALIYAAVVLVQKIMVLGEDSPLIEETYIDPVIAIVADNADDQEEVEQPTEPQENQGLNPFSFFVKDNKLGEITPSKAKKPNSLGFFAQAEDNETSPALTIVSQSRYFVAELMQQNTGSTYTTEPRAVQAS